MKDKRWGEMLKLKAELGIEKKITKEHAGKVIWFHSMLLYFRANALNLNSEERKILKGMLEG